MGGQINKERVTCVAMKEFFHRGIKAVKMDDLAGMLGMSKRTLYKMSGDKENLLLEGLDYYLSAYQNDILSYASHTENILEVILHSFNYRLEILRQIDYRFFKDLRRYPRVVDFLKLRDNEMSKHFVESLELGVRQGMFREDVNYHILAILIVEQMRIGFETDVWRNYPPSEIFSSIVLVNVRGILTPKGVMVLDDFLRTGLKKPYLNEDNETNS